MPGLKSPCFCSADEIAARLATAQAELQRAQDAVAEKEGSLLLLQDKAEVISRKVQPTAKELADAQAAVKAKKAEVEAAKARVAEASRRFADLQKEADMEHRRAEAALSEAAQKETGLSQNILLFCLGLVIRHLSSNDTCKAEYLCLVNR